MNDRRDPQPNDLLSFGPFSLLTAERLLKKTDESIPLGGRANSSCGFGRNYRMLT